MKKTILLLLITSLLVCSVAYAEFDVTVNTHFAHPGETITIHVETDTYFYQVINICDTKDCEIDKTISTFMVEPCENPHPELPYKCASQDIQYTIPEYLLGNKWWVNVYDYSDNRYKSSELAYFHVTAKEIGGIEPTPSTPDVDSDGDGMDDVWEMNHGLDPTLDDAGFDGDDDGLTNLQEYQLGTDPAVFDDFPEATEIAPSSTGPSETQLKQEGEACNLNEECTSGNCIGPNFHCAPDDKECYFSSPWAPLDVGQSSNRTPYFDRGRNICWKKCSPEICIPDKRAEYYPKCREDKDYCTWAPEYASGYRLQCRNTGTDSLWVPPCPEGTECVNGECLKLEEEEGIPCDWYNDCPDGLYCTSNEHCCLPGKCYFWKEGCVPVGEPVSKEHKDICYGYNDAEGDDIKRCGRDVDYCHQLEIKGEAVAECHYNNILGFDTWEAPCSDGKVCDQITGECVFIEAGKIAVVPTTQEDKYILPPSWDWRNVHSENWLTPVKNQNNPFESDNSWAFGEIGVLESQINLYFNQHLDVDLSEQHLIDCREDKTNVDGMSMFNEIYPECFCDTHLPSVEYCIIAQQGLSDESCDIYSSREAIPSRSCTQEFICNNWKERVWKNTGYYDYITINYPYEIPNCAQYLTTKITEEDLKKLLVTKGPLLSGRDRHQMVLVGYKEENGITNFIFKDSHGVNEDEEGYTTLEFEEILFASLPLGPFIPPTGESYEINCVDKDNDEYCNWGISESMPETCPSFCKEQKDCDDSNPNLGPFISETNFNCQPIETDFESTKICEDGTPYGECNSNREYCGYENLIKNSGFEVDDEPSLFYGFVGGAEVAGDGQTASDLIMVEPNKKYRISGWIKTNLTKGRAYVAVYQYETENSQEAIIPIKMGRTIGHFDAFSKGGSEDWTYYTSIFETESDTRYLKIMLDNWGSSGVSGVSRYKKIKLTDGIPEGWRVTDNEGKIVALFDATEKYGVDGSLKIDYNNGYWSGASQCLASGDFDVGVRYTVNLKYKCTAGNARVFLGDVKSGDHPGYTSTVQESAQCTGSWEDLTAPLYIPPDHTGNLCVYVYGHFAPSGAHYDNILLSAPENLIENGGFGDGDLHWTMNNPSHGSIDNGRYEIYDASVSGNNNFLTQEITLGPGTYTLSADIQTNDVVYLGGEYNYGSGIGVYDKGKVLEWNWEWSRPALTGTNSEKRISKSFTVTEEAVISVYLIQGNAGPATGTTWFDNIRLEKIQPQLIEDCGICGCDSGEICGVEGVCSEEVQRIIVAKSIPDIGGAYIKTFEELKQETMQVAKIAGLADFQENTLPDILHPFVLYKDIRTIRNRVDSGYPYDEWWNKIEGQKGWIVNYDITKWNRIQKSRYSKLMAFVYDVTREGTKKDPNAEDYGNKARDLLLNMDKGGYSGYEDEESLLNFAEAYDIMKGSGYDFEKERLSSCGYDCECERIWYKPWEKECKICYGCEKNIKDLLRSQMKQVATTEIYNAEKGTSELFSDNVMRKNNHHIRRYSVVGTAALVLENEEFFNNAMEGGTTLGIFGDALDLVLGVVSWGLGILGFDGASQSVDSIQFDYKGVNSGINHQLISDTEGGWAEGPHYMEYTFLVLIPFMKAMDNADVDYSWLNVRKLKSLIDWSIKIRMPNGQRPPYDNSAPETSYFFGGFFDNPVYNWDWIKSDKEYYTRWDSAVQKIDAISYYDSSIGEQEPSWTPTQFLPSAGNMVFRSDWGDDAVYLMALGEHGTAFENGYGHEHDDVFSFILYAYGKELAIDSGYYDWNDPKNPEKAENHNVVLNKYGGRIAKEGYIKTEDSFTTGSLDYGRIKDKYDDDGRSILFVDKKYFIIYDKLKNTDGYIWRMHGNGLEGQPTFKRYNVNGDLQGGEWIQGDVSLLAYTVAEPNEVSFDKSKHYNKMRGDGEYHTYMSVSKQTNSFLSLLYPKKEGVYPLITEESDDKADILKLEKDNWKGIAFVNKNNQEITIADELGGIVTDALKGFVKITDNQIEYIFADDVTKFHVGGEVLFDSDNPTTIAILFDRDNIGIYYKYYDTIGNVKLQKDGREVKIN